VYRGWWREIEFVDDLDEEVIGQRLLAAGQSGQEP